MADDPRRTPDDDLREVRQRSKALRVLLDNVGVKRFREDLPRLQPIRVPIDFSDTLDTARVIYRLVKNDHERVAFLKEPTRTLSAAGLTLTSDEVARVVELVKELSNRTRLHNPGDVFDSYTSKESDTHQQWNFDSSGRSAESTTGAIVGEKKDFSGFGLVDEIFANPALGVTFFPEQPLVTPELIADIRRRLSPRVMG